MALLQTGGLSASSCNAAHSFNPAAPNGNKLNHAPCRYELLCGETPFNEASPKLTMALIAETTKDPHFPSHLSASAIDLIKRLLKRDSTARLVSRHGHGNRG